MKKPLLTPWIWIPSAVILILIAFIYLSGVDHALFLALNRAGHVLGEAFWSQLTILGDGAITLSLILLTIRRSPRAFWGALIAALLTTLLVQLVKSAVAYERPAAVFLPDEFFQYGPRLRHSSFPSGHSAAIFTLAGVWILCLSGHTLLRAALFAVAVLTALSRIMVGVHWPLDVLCGMLIGLCSAYAGVWIAARYQWTTDCNAGLIAGMLLMLIAVALLASPHIGIPIAMPLQRTLGAFCLLCGVIEIYRMRHARVLKRA